MAPLPMDRGAKASPRPSGLEPQHLAVSGLTWDAACRQWEDAADLHKAHHTWTCATPAEPNPVSTESDHGRSHLCPRTRCEDDSSGTSGLTA